MTVGRSGGLQQRLAHEIGGGAGRALAHRLGAMALERPRADVHSQGALLVGAALADQAQHLPLALRQRLLALLAREHHPRRTPDVPAATALALAALLVIGIGRRRWMTIRNLLDQGADAFGLLKRVSAHLLQETAIAGRLPELGAVLLVLVHVEQERSQGTVHLRGDRAPRLFRRPKARS